MVLLGKVGHLKQKNIKVKTEAVRKKLWEVSILCHRAAAEKSHFKRKEVLLVLRMVPYIY